MAGKLQNEDHKSLSELTGLGADKTKLLNTDKIYTPKSDEVLETTLRKNNFSAIIDPDVNNDSTQDYEVGSRWINTDTDVIFTCVDNSAGAAIWSEGGGSGIGGLDVFDAENFEKLSIADFSKDQNATYLVTGGTFGGVLSDETASPISGSQTPKYTAGVASTNDWFDIKTIDIDKKQQGEWAGVTLYADMTNFSQDVDFVVYDRTNNASLTKTGLDILVGGKEKSRYSFSVNIPDTCTQISYGFHMVNAPVNTESFIVDDVEFSLNPFAYKDIVSKGSYRASGHAGYGSIDTKIPYFSSVTINTLGRFGTISNSSANGWSFTANQDCTVAVSYIGSSGAATDQYGLSLNSNQLTTNIFNITQAHRIAYDIPASVGEIFHVTRTIELSAGDVLRPHTSAATPSAVEFSIEVSSTTEHVVTPSESAVTQTKFLTANVTTQSDMSDLTFTGLIVGHEYFLSGQIKMASFDNQETSVNFRSASGGLGTVYGQIQRRQGVGTSFDSGTYAVGLFFTAVSDTLYVRKADANPKPVYGNNTKHETFLQLTNKTKQFLAAVPVEQVAYIKDIKTSGTNGGNSSINTVQTRDLNTIAGDLDIVSLSSNQFTLKRGKYDISASCPAFQVDQHQAFLYNVTDSIYQIDGSCEYSETGNMIGTNRSFVDGVLTVTKNTVFELRHWTSDGVTGGLGVATDVHASNPQSGEVYSVVRIRKLR